MEGGFVPLDLKTSGDPKGRHLTVTALKRQLVYLPLFFRGDPILQIPR